MHGDGFTEEEELTAERDEALRASKELAVAARRLVNARLPVDLDPEREFWVAARNVRATLSIHAKLTGVDGEQDVRG